MAIPRTKIALLDATVQETGEWLTDTWAGCHRQDWHWAYMALRTTLHAQRDCLPMPAAARLGAQLPLLIHGMYYEGWLPTDKPHKEGHLEGFLALIREYFSCSLGVDAEIVARAVFKVLANLITAGELKDVRRVLASFVCTIPLLTSPAEA